MNSDSREFVFVDSSDSPDDLNRWDGSAGLSRHAISTACDEAYALDLSSFLDQIGTHPFHGLSSEDITTRRAAFGRNELEDAPSESILRKLLSGLSEPLIVLLIIAALISLGLGEFEDAIGIIIAVLIVNAVGFWTEYKSDKSVDALKELVTHRCQVIRNGQAREIPAEDLVIGDLVLLTVGARVPADLRLIDAAKLTTDESILTGEVHPAKKDHAATLNFSDPLHLRSNLVFMGTMTVSGTGKGVVIHVGHRTQVGQVASEIGEMEPPRSPLQQNLDHLGKVLSTAAIVLVMLIFCVGFLQGKPPLQMFTIAVSLAVAAIPEGLPIVVTVTLALGVNRMAQRNAIVRKLPIVESLGATSVICSDKTGTLTMNQMSVRALFTDHYTFIHGHGYAPTGTFHPLPLGSPDFSPAPSPLHHDYMSSLSGLGALSTLMRTMHETMQSVAPVDPRADPHLVELLMAGVFCNNSHFVSESAAHVDKLIGQPTEGAILNAARRAGLEDLRNSYPRIEEIPFDSETKWMATRYDFGSSAKYYVKGAPEVLLRQCTSIYHPGLEHHPLTPHLIDNIVHEVTRMGEAGLRTVGFAVGTQLNSLTWLGLMGLSDPVRPAVKTAISKCLDAKIDVVMLTGDSQETARSIATELGFFDHRSRMLSGTEVDRMSVTELAASELERVQVFYRVSPSHKTKIVSAFQMKNQVVAMTGDGINDAPALKKAHIGIAMGTGTDVAKEAGDVILLDDNFSTIEAAIEEGRSIYQNIKNFVRFQLTTSIATLSLIALSTLSDLPLPLNTIQILFVNIIMDGPPAQTLGMEPYDPDIMKNPPRRPDQPIFQLDLLRSIATGSLTIFLGTLWIFWSYLPADYGSSHNYDGEDLIMHDPMAVDKAMTVAFATFVLYQLLNALNCRSISKSIFSISPLSNPSLIIALGGCLAMLFAIIYLPIFQTFFSTVPLSMYEFIHLFLVASTVLIVDELRKSYWISESKSSLLHLSSSRSILPY